MLQDSIRFAAELPARDQDCGVPGSAADIATGIVSALMDLDLEPRVIRSSSGITAGGTDLQVRPVDLEQSAAARQHFLRRLTSLVLDHIPVTLSLRGLGPGNRSIDVFEKFCQTVRQALDGDRLLMARVSLSLRSHQMPLEAYLLISRALLGNGRRYILFDSLQMKHHDQAVVREETERNWSLLWRQRSLANPLTPAYGAGVRTACPLLGDEAAEAVLPLLGIQVPADSAWLPIRLHLPRFADENGQIAWTRLAPTLEACIDLGDQLLDVLGWATPGQRSDAWLNRRLGIDITGTGDLVAARGMDPAGLECLGWVDEIIRRIRKTLWDRSRVIAGRTGVVPALEHSDPSAGLRDLAHRRNWQRRWRLALANSAVRHRNVLVMSPYSLLPQDSNDPVPFTDLLPVLRHADAFAFAGRIAAGDWSIEQFRRFHTRAWAVMQRRNARSLIATGV